MSIQKTKFDDSLYQALSDTDVDAKLKELPEWKRDGKAIVRVETFPNYLDAIKYINRVGFAAEENNHHPDILMNYKRVEVRYWTHKARGITELDLKMARKVEDILSSFSR